MDPWSISQFLRTLCCFFFGGGLTWPCGIVGNCAGHNHQVLFSFFNRFPFLFFLLSLFYFVQLLLLLSLSQLATVEVTTISFKTFLPLLPFSLSLFSCLFPSGRDFDCIIVWIRWHLTEDKTVFVNAQFFLGNGSGKRICAIRMQLLESWGLPILS